VVPHQSNVRIIDEAAALSGIPREKFYVNMRLTGNTSAASVPLALSGAYVEGLLKSNTTIVLVSYGAGLSFGAAVLKW
jgi:3-oxoacyl-[acyl-carrier-protein] synthase III